MDFPPFKTVFLHDSPRRERDFSATHWSLEGSLQLQESFPSDPYPNTFGEGALRTTYESILGDYLSTFVDGLMSAMSIL